jgi:hypothetical protein
VVAKVLKQWINFEVINFQRSFVVKTLESKLLLVKVLQHLEVKFLTIKLVLAFILKVSSDIIEVEGALLVEVSFRHI